MRDKEPESSGFEGLAGVRVVRAIYESAQHGNRVQLSALPSKRRPALRQEIHRLAQGKPETLPLVSPGYCRAATAIYLCLELCSKAARSDRPLSVPYRCMRSKASARWVQIPGGLKLIKYGVPRYAERGHNQGSKQIQSGGLSDVCKKTYVSFDGSCLRRLGSGAERACRGSSACGWHGARSRCRECR